MQTLTPRRRDGLNLLVATSLVAMLAMVAGFTSRRAARASSRWTRRQAEELRAHQLARAALEEATHVVARAVNDPGSPAYRALRAPGDGAIAVPVAVPRARGLAAELAGFEAVKVQAYVVGRSPLTSWSDPGTEWRGTLELSAEVRWAEGLLRAEELREVQANRLRLPFPFDTYCHYDHRFPAPGQVRGPVHLGPAFFGPTASLRVEPDESGDVQGPFEELLATTRGLHGVIYVANAGARPLRLRGRRLRGRAVLVVEGELEVNELRLQDPSRDRLALVALGEATLIGEVEADVLLGHGPGAPPPPREMFRGLEVRGSFLVATGGYESLSPFDLDCGAPRRPLRLDEVLLSVGPAVEAARVGFPMPE